jgi:hypothetical protein
MLQECRQRRSRSLNQVIQRDERKSVKRVNVRRVEG